MTYTGRLLLAATLALVVPARARAAIESAPSGPIIAQLVTRLLEQQNYRRHPADVETSRQMLRNYLDFLDYNHMILDATDVADFNTRYGDGLGSRLRDGDVQPAYEIFDRFLARLEKRVALVHTLTASTPTFTTDESFILDRHELPWPAPEQTRELWRLRIKLELLQEKIGQQKSADLTKTVNTRYDRLLRSYREFDSNDILQEYLTALAHVYDPHSDYLAAAQKENFDISMRLSLVGIGALLRSEDGYARIVSIFDGSPAAKSKKLKPNDKIEAVAQGDGPFIDAVGMKLDRLVQMIRGEKGTVVRLRIIPTDAIDPTTRVVISLVRDEIKLIDQEAKAKVITLRPAQRSHRAEKIGVIDLPSFYSDMKSGGQEKSTTRDVARLVEKLKNDHVDGIVLDLRRNGGGALSEAVGLTGLFIHDGPVVQVRDARGFIRVLQNSDSHVIYRGPLAVLTSRGSASASEILAAALQDYGRAVIIGDKSTFGKGTVQSVIELSQYMPPAFSDYRPGALKMTIQKFYRISGGSTQNRGVIPDIQLPSVEDYVDMTETSLKSALPYDEIEPADYDKSDAIASQLPALRKASSARVIVSTEFAYVREDIERYRKQLAEKSVSLNEAKRLAEKKADEALETKRKKERAARKEPAREEREITLEELDGKAPAAKVVVSSAPAVSSGTLAGDDYEKAPPGPDVELDESLHVVEDMAVLSAVPPRAAALK